MSAAQSTVAYADGSCIGNPGPGGWGVVILQAAASAREFSGGERETTNNRMEMTAALQALGHTDRRVDLIVHSDSQYLVNTLNRQWKRKKNLDLWEQLDAALRGRKVAFEWVEGHAGDPLNERADALARTAARAIAQGRLQPGVVISACGPQQAVAPPPSPAPGGSEPARAIEPLLRPGETVTRCASCGVMFVAAGAALTHCSRVECQLAARRARA